MRTRSARGGLLAWLAVLLGCTASPSLAWLPSDKLETVPAVPISGQPAVLRVSQLLSGPTITVDAVEISTESQVLQVVAYLTHGSTGIFPAPYSFKRDLPAIQPGTYQLKYSIRRRYDAANPYAEPQLQVEKEVRIASWFSYVDLARQNPSPVRVAQGETMRLQVFGSACTRYEHNEEPVIVGQAIEFTIGFNAGCFGVPPPFRWTRDVEAPPGNYEVRFFRRTVGDSVGPKSLANVRRVIVGPRPDAHAASNAGTTDRSFGSDGAVQVPGYSYTGRIAEKLADGALMLLDKIGIRVLEDGSIDGSFPEPPISAHEQTRWTPVSVSVAPDGTIWTAGVSLPLPSSLPQITVRRTDAGGRGLSSLAIDPSLLVPESGHADWWARALDIATLADGKAVVVGHANSAAGVEPCAGRAIVARLLTDGRLDPAYGVGGIARPLLPGCIVRVAPARNGGTWLLGTYDLATPANFLTKLDGNGNIDPTFGQQGTAFGAFARARPIESPDGRIVLGGAGFHIVRLLPSGAMDPGFGVSGILPNPTQFDVELQDFGVDGSGGVLLAGLRYVGYAAGNRFLFWPVVVRYGPDQRWDKEFGQDGIYVPAMQLALQSRSAIDALTLLPVTETHWALAGIAEPVGSQFAPALYVHRFRGVADPTRSPVTEYFHADLDHYFYTADPNEIALLDQGTIQGWARTGQSFNAYANTPDDAWPVCRFFSAAFAPKSSHFYTGSAAECEVVKGLPAWTFEGATFSMPLPDETGACPWGTRVVYRSYNQGKGGAPAHRLTTSSLTIGEMDSAGWVREGFGIYGVTLCSPN